MHISVKAHAYSNTNVKSKCNLEKKKPTLKGNSIVPKLRITLLLLIFLYHVYLFLAENPIFLK